MSPEQFRTWSSLLSEALLLTSKDGQIYAVNESVRQLGFEPQELEQKNLSELASASSEKLKEFLHLCSRSKQPLLTSLILNSQADQEIVCRCDGMLAQHESEGGETTLLLKLSPKESTVLQYQLVNEKISELDQEIKRRIALEKTLQDRNESLNAAIFSVAAQKNALELLVKNAPLEDVLDALCQVIEGQGQQQLIATVLLVDEDGLRLRSTAGRRAPTAYSQAVDGVPIGPEFGSCGTAAFRGEQVIVSDIHSDPLWRDFKELALEHGLQACWSTPIFSSANTVLGTFAVYAPKPCQPTADQLGLIEVLARTAGIAVERRRDEEALRVADRRKDEFLATLAHELRNPLAPICTGLEVMKLSMDDPDTINEVRQMMERQTQQLITLVNDLLDVSRITRGKFELRKTSVNLADVLKTAIEASMPMIEESGHDFSKSIPEEPVYLEADSHRLAQVISNLLNNAAKYTPKQGRILLSVEILRNSVWISVRDTGVGIPVEMQNRIFEMFTQIESPEHRSYSGLGIGLTLVKSLVERHDGQISVESQGPNQGSTFRVRLPILNTAPEVEAESIAVAKNHKEFRVLIVDDNLSAAKMLEVVVKELGHEVQSAHDGRQAINIAEAFRPQVILMDLGMPIMDGYEAARHIRRQPWGKKITLVATTGWGQESDKLKSKEAGFDCHLTKPVELSSLTKLFQEKSNPLEVTQDTGK